MYKEPPTKNLVNFKTAKAAVFAKVRIVSKLDLKMRFLLTFWVGVANVSSGRERLTILIITVISRMIFRTLQASRGM